MLTADHSICKLTDAAVLKPDEPEESNTAPEEVNGHAAADEATLNDILDADTRGLATVRKGRIPLRNSPPQWTVLTKEHFSFSTRVKLGDFMEQKPGERVSKADSIRLRELSMEACIDWF